ncbi:MAG: hypothetical protein CMH04_00975 [Marinovum sp.]|nr:hypothetical protein [Marinovum sp.]|tara:strand:+ start:2009 stop:3082 length:1074 start_codon:yes stop_codon:yes gene_type:complete
MLVYVGTYTIDSKSKGIYPFRLDSNTGSLTRCAKAISLTNPTFITSSANNLFAVSEVADVNGTYGGSVNTYHINKETGALTFINSQSTQGAYPCHVALDTLEKQLAVSNYMGGNIVVYPIKENGKIGDLNDVAQHYGGSKGNTERQEGPHAHSVIFTPDNKYALVADLGKDMVLSYSLTAQGKLMSHKNGVINTELGQGPRHMEFHPNGQFMFLLNELGNTIQSFKYHNDSGVLEQVNIISSLPSDFKGDSIAADIHVHPSGKFLYASNRGQDSLVLCAINQENGVLEVLGHQSTFGKHPRNFSIDPTGNFLLVANKDSNNIVTFKIDQDSGILSSINENVEVTQPVCIHFLKIDNN